MARTFEQGWAARPFKEQFPELSEERARVLDLCNEAITHLYLVDLLTDSQVDAIRGKKMPKLVAQELADARHATVESGNG